MSCDGTPTRPHRLYGDSGSSRVVAAKSSINLPSVMAARPIRGQRCPQPLPNPEPAPEHEHHVHVPPQLNRNTPSLWKRAYLNVALIGCLSFAVQNRRFHSSAAAFRDAAVRQETRPAPAPSPTLTRGSAGIRRDPQGSSSARLCCRWILGTTRMAGLDLLILIKLLSWRIHVWFVFGVFISVFLTSFISFCLFFQSSCHFPVFPVFFSWLLTEDRRTSLLLQLLSSFSRQPCWFLGSLNSRFQPPC